MADIHFGTSGWRAIIAEDFTFANVKRACQAIAMYLRHHSLQKKGVVIGFDNRFHSEVFAELAARVLTGNNVRVFMVPEPVPTPALAVEIRKRDAGGGINFTASHNPAEYHGLKFSTGDGAPALPEVTAAIEAFLQEVKKVEMMDLEEAEQKKLYSTISVKENYFATLREIVDFEAIRKAQLKIGYDPLYGVGMGYLDQLLKEEGIEVMMLHDWRDPFFGGKSPEPDVEQLAELKELVLNNSLNIGISNDGDADRFGILDEKGRYLSSNQVLVLLALHLIKHKKKSGSIVRTLATTHLLDKIAAAFEREPYEVPVGFKYIGELILKREIVIGGEESGGLSIGGHIPEKDGILACLLCLELLAYEQKPISQILAEIYQTYGYFYNDRIGVQLTPEFKETIRDILAHEHPKTLMKQKIEKFDTRDGLKMTLANGNWLLIRFSGTEPKARVYAEAGSETEMKMLLEEGKSLLQIKS